MPEPLAAALNAVRADLLDRSRLRRAVAAGRRHGASPPWRRAELRWVDVRGGPHLQTVTYDETQAFTRNLAPTEATAAVDELLALPFGSWHVDTVTGSTQLRVTKRGDAQVHYSPTGRSDNRELALLPHDRVKPRLLDPGDPFLRAVGISDAEGRVKPSRKDKYRQVEAFLRTLEPVLPAARAAAGTGRLRVVDLGCGNAYLTFAAYRRLAGEDADGVEVVGVDVKAAARARNAALAERLGRTGMRFVEGSIAGADVGPVPHLVLALHACDTATDEALARAVRWHAPVVLAAPCCHHDLQAQLHGGTALAPYALLGGHGILRERFADVATDALRAALLRLVGYRVEVVEFVGSRHTPRNVLLRAVRTGAAPPDRLRADYVELTSAWAVTPALERMLAAELRPLLARRPDLPSGRP